MLHSTPITDLHDGYAALLKILADPDLHKKRLEELMVAEKGARDEINALNQMAAITRRRSSEAEAAMIVAKNRAAKLDAREAEIDEKAKSLETLETRRSDRALQLREDAVSQRENIAKIEAERLAAVRADLDAKIAKFKKLHAESAL
jgi:ABC-type transporter Mla subunit MlaD